MFTAWPFSPERTAGYFTAAHQALVRNYEEKGMCAEAVAEELRVESLAGRSPEQIESLRNAFAMSGIRGFWEKRREWEKRELNHPLWYAKIPSGSHLTEMLALACSASLR